MICPICSNKTRIIDSRKQDDCVIRRRECISCKSRFTTIEIDMDIYKNLLKRKDEHDVKKNDI